MRLTILLIILLTALGYFALPKLTNPIAPLNTLIKPVSTTNSPLIQPSARTLTVEDIFSTSHDFAKNLPPENLITLIATGDIIPARSVNFRVVNSHNPKWPFEKTASLLQDGDLVFINLESPLINNCPATVEGMIFCGDSSNLEGLLFVGVDIANLANNHAGNYGLEGIEQTTQSLNQAGVLTTGRSEAVYKEVKGIRFAFLGYNTIGAPEAGISWAKEEIIQQEIAQAKKQADVIVVTFHWGTEYVSQPTEEQRQLAHLAIDAGADLIIGNHPHWIQPVEIYKNKLITYAHGNFIFDQMWSEKTREGVVGKYTFYRDELVDVQFFPIKIFDYGQPQLMDSSEGRAVLNEMKSESLKLQEREVRSISKTLAP